VVLLLSIFLERVLRATRNQQREVVPYATAGAGESRRSSSC